MSDRTPQPLDLTPEHVEAILDRVAAMLYADVRPVLAQRERDRQAEAAVVAEADNVVSLDGYRERRAGRARRAS